MQRIKTIILILIIILGFVLNMSIYRKILKKQKENQTQGKLQTELQRQTDNYFENNTIREIDNQITKYNVRACVEKYFYVLNNLWSNLEEQRIYGEEEINTDIKYEFNEYFAGRLLGILAEEYIKESNLTENNIESRYTYFKQQKVIITNIYQYDIKSGISMYFVNGYNIGNDGTSKKNFKMILLTDKNENTFSIYPEEYLKKHELENLKVGNKCKILNNVDKIEKNDYNNLENKIVNDEMIAEDYFYLYKFNMKYDTEAAYNMLDDEYKRIRFGNLKNYQNYVSENYIQLISQLDKYEVKKEDDYKQYTCIDKKGKYYIFRETGVMKCSVILDTYTIDLPEFIEKYNSADAQKKVALNIQKCIDAINVKDYEYVYSKLSDGFKKNYFTMLDSFKDYINKTFYNNIKIEYKEFSEVSGVYKYVVEISDSENSNSSKVQKTFIVKLGEDTGFEMSFNV